MDIGKIFDKYESNEESSLLIDFSDHPLFWIGGFIKIINNYDLLKSDLVSVLKITNPKLSNSELSFLCKKLSYDKAYNYIKKFKTNNKFHCECLKLKVNNDLYLNVDKLIMFYETLEEYEKCSHLFKLKNKIKEFLT